MKYKIIINLKAYDEATGKKALKIAKIAKKLEKYAKTKDVDIILCPQAIDLRDIQKEKVKVYAQHIDPVKPGAHTGYNLPLAVKDAKAIGTLISHSEHQLKISEIEQTLKIAKEYGLETCVCARDAKRAQEIANLNPKPNYIAVEPKELIGGDISISTAKPELIKKCKTAIKKIDLLVGAGVKNKEDIKIAIKLGAKGVLLASGIVKAKNIEKELKELIDGFIK